LARLAVFLDRDGTLNVRPGEHEYVTRPEDFEWLPGAPEAVARLASLGHLIAVVSNQRGVALGRTSPATLSAIEDRIQERLRPLGCQVDAFRYCVHDVDAGCSCRKPAPGMLLDLARDLDIDLARSWMVGDTDADVAAGRAAGCRTAHIGSTGVSSRADVVAPSLLTFAGIVAREAHAHASTRSNPSTSAR
jgi:D-glycero-D-manno-heptose 1,7-bisphosphate phosphatase